MPTNKMNNTLDVKEQLLGIARGDSEVFDEIFALQVENQVDSGLDARTFNLVRLAALASVDAAPASWLMNLTLSDAEEVPFAQILGMFVAIAPLIGTARIVSATGTMLRALGLAESLEEADDPPAPARSSP